MAPFFSDFGLYTVDVSYLEYLHSVDDEVEFDERGNYERKPFLGVFMPASEHSYLIPMTSAKSHHADDDLVGETNFLIYKSVRNRSRNKNKVYKTLDDGSLINILSVLEVMKMIPVRKGVYRFTEFSSLDDKQYADLCRKEWSYCKNIRRDIVAKAHGIYEYQKRTTRVLERHCSFSLLEDACASYVLDNAIM